MRRPPPAPASPPAPPPRRTAAAPPPRRAPGASPGLRPAPSRASGPARGHARSTRRRRGPVLVAAALTVVILLGYGGYTAWDAITGDEAPTTAATGNGFVASAERAASNGQFAIWIGLNLRILKDGVHFVDGMDRTIGQVQTERANLERLAARANGTKADILRSSILAVDTLENGMVQWRDGIVNLRLAGVAAAESSMETAITQLRTDIARWNARSS